jgi:DNA-binding phage protein
MTPAGQALFAQIRVAIVRQGWSETARRSGVRRETLHRTFGPNPDIRAPNLNTIDAVVTALGLRLSLTRADPGA